MSEKHIPAGSDISNPIPNAMHVVNCGGRCALLAL